MTQYKLDLEALPKDVREQIEAIVKKKNIKKREPILKNKIIAIVRKYQPIHHTMIIAALWTDFNTKSTLKSLGVYLAKIKKEGIITSDRKGFYFLPKKPKDLNDETVADPIGSSQEKEPEEDTKSFLPKWLRD